VPSFLLELCANLLNPPCYPSFVTLLMDRKIVLYERYFLTLRSGEGSLLLSAAEKS